jgi:hypothetical protein
MKTSLNWTSALWGVVLTGAIGIAVLGLPANASAQTQAAGGGGIATVDATGKLTKAPIVVNQDIASIDAARGALDRFLDEHPEIANEVVENPSAMSDMNYLKDHPAMEAFLESHPLVKADPRSFISPREWRIERPGSELNDLMGYVAPLCALIGFLLAGVWVIRAFLDNRRWNRSFKMHEDLHSKLIEKFASGQDFNTYMQSEGGRRLLEWTPPATSSSSPGLPNPVGRILWSLQAGLVLLLMGYGLLQIRFHMAANDASALLVFGTLGVTLGAGFVLSALISYGLSRHLGLIKGTTQAGESIVKP